MVQKKSKIGTAQDWAEYFSGVSVRVTSVPTESEFVPDVPHADQMSGVNTQAFAGNNAERECMCCGNAFVSPKYADYRMCRMCRRWT